MPAPPWRIDKPQIEDVLEHPSARAGAYGKIVVVDNFKLQNASAKPAAKLDS
jgi:hypothetical protein